MDINTVLLAQIFAALEWKFTTTGKTFNSFILERTIELLNDDEEFSKAFSTVFCKVVKF